MVADRARLLRRRPGDREALQVVAVQDAVVGELAVRRLDVLVAEIVLAPDHEGQVRAHRRAVALEEADQAAEVVGVAVAQDQAVELGGLMPSSSTLLASTSAVEPKSSICRRVTSPAVEFE